MLQRTSLLAISGICCILIIAASAAEAADAKNSHRSKQSNFIRYLTRNNEYARASLELERTNVLYPGYYDADLFLTTSAYLDFKIGRYSRILNADIPTLLTGQPHPCNIFRIDALRFSKNFKKAAELSNTVCQPPDNDSELNQICRKRIFASNLQEYIKTGISNHTDILHTSEFEAYRELLQYTKKEHKNKVSPAAAAVFGVVPGMGYAYGGDVATGAVAFTVTAVCTAISMLSFNSGMKPAGIVFGAVGFFFYSGSIVGGYMQANRYNQSISDSLMRNIEEKMKLDEDREKIFNKNGLGK